MFFLGKSGQNSMFFLGKNGQNLCNRMIDRCLGGLIKNHYENSRGQIWQELPQAQRIG